MNAITVWAKLLIQNGFVSYAHFLWITLWKSAGKAAEIYVLNWFLLDWKEIVQFVNLLYLKIKSNLFGRSKKVIKKISRFIIKKYFCE